MRFAHISDLHLGKRLKERSLEEDQRHILKEIVRICTEEKVDGVLIAGDVFDDGNTFTNEASAMLDDFLTELSERGLPVFMISGNHDSMDKLNFGSRMFRKSGLYISSVFSGKADRYPLTKDGQTVDIYLLPFIKPIHVKRAYPDERIETYEDAIRCVLEHSDRSDNKKIIVSHQTVLGGGAMPEMSDSERAFIGGSESINSSVYRDFDYVALGHIHSPMNMGSETIRYCGAPLKYALSRKEKDKSVTIVDIGEDVKVSTVPLKPLHDVRILKGPLDKLIEEGKNDPNSDDYIGVLLEGFEMNPMEKLREVYPNVLAMEYVKTGEQSGSLIEDMDLEKLDADEEFEKYFKSKTGEEMTESQKKLIHDLFEANGVVL